MPTYSHNANSNITRRWLLVVVAVGVIAVAVWGAARMQHHAADRSFELGRAGQQMMVAMLDQQTAVRGFALTRQEAFLDPYREGAVDFEEAVGVARRLADPEVRNEIEGQVVVARR